jgi:hypothetical protein
MIKPDYLNGLSGRIGVREEGDHGLLVKAHDPEADDLRDVFALPV